MLLFSHSKIDLLEYMKQVIGHPDEVFNKTVVDKVYEGLEMSADDYLGKYSFRLFTFKRCHKIRFRLRISIVRRFQFFLVL